MTTRDRIFLESKAWAEEKLSLDENYFRRLDGMHAPGILWIGSSDSLVPVRELTNTEPGEVLVYRNVASQVREDDISMMAMIQDAVESEQIKYIVVCGYSHCSGIRNVLLGTDDRPYVRDWLKNIRGLYEKNRNELERLDFSRKEKRLSELNIELQIKNLSKIESIQRAWEKTNYPILYGWYFDLFSGGLKEVYAMENNRKLKRVSSLLSA